MSSARLFSHPFANSYCALCDQYFHDNRQREEHIINSSKHPECWRCGRRFINKKAMLQHVLTTPGHHYCAMCDKQFRTAGGMRVHNEHAHPEGDDYDSDDEYDEDEEERPEGWEDYEGEDLYPDEASEPGDIFEDTSFEQDDSCDFEDPDYLGSAPHNHGYDSDDTEEEDLSDDVALPHVCCPMCEKEDENMCATSCGHVYCLRCVTSAIKYTGECPTCDEKICQEELRRIYISSH